LQSTSSGALFDGDLVLWICGETQTVRTSAVLC
jgi:hypothetical protein